MKNEFVPYAESLDLKELRFDESCFAGYLIDTKELWIGYVGSQGGEQFNKEYHISAPTFSQAFKFFREKHNLILDILAFYEEHQLPLSYNNVQKPKGYFVWDYYDENFSIDKSPNFETYEEAELACLRRLIEIVKERL